LVLLFSVILLAAIAALGWLVYQKTHTPPKAAPSPKDQPKYWIEKLPEDEAERWLRNYGPKATSELLPALSNSDVQVRWKVAQILGDYGPEALEAIPDLRKRLRDPERNVRIAALDSLLLIGAKERQAVVLAILDGMGTADENFRIRLLNALRHVGPLTEADVPILELSYGQANSEDRVRLLTTLDQMRLGTKLQMPVIQRAIKDKDHLIRLTAITSLRRLGKEARTPGLSLLLEAGKDADPKIAQAAVESLPLMGTPTMHEIPALGELVQNRDLPVSVRKSALTALGYAGRSERSRVLDALLEVMRSDKADLRKTASLTLRQLGPPDATERKRLAMWLSMKDESAERRLYAAWALGQLGHEASDCVPQMLRAMLDPNLEISRAAAQLVLPLLPKNKETADALAQMMEKDDVDLRITATKGLNLIRTAPGAFAGLIKGLSDEDPEIVHLAAEALDGFNKGSLEEMMPGLLNALNDSKIYVRLYALQAIANIGPKAKEAINPLLDLLKDENAEIVLRSLKALKSLKADSPFAMVHIQKVLDHKNPAIRVQVADMMLAMKTEMAKCAGVLLEVLKSGQKDLHENAKTALEQIDATATDDTAVPLIAVLFDKPVMDHGGKALIRMGKTAMPRVEKLLDSENPNLRFAAIHILAEIGSAAKGTVPKLETMAKSDKEMWVRKKAKEASEKIGK
jgi:HEAT repeat protein